MFHIQSYFIFPILSYRLTFLKQVIVHYIILPKPQSDFPHWAKLCWDLDSPSTLGESQLRTFQEVASYIVLHKGQICDWQTNCENCFGNMVFTTVYTYLKNAKNCSKVPRFYMKQNNSLPLFVDVYERYFWFKSRKSHSKMRRPQEILELYTIIYQNCD